MKGTYIGELH